MRIAVVTPEYPPDHIGGGGIAAAALAFEYSKRHEVRVFSAWDTHRSWRGRPLAEQPSGVSVYRYPLVPLFRSQPYFRSVVPPNATATARLGRDLNEWSPNVAHLHGFGYAIVDLAAAMLAWRKTPYIFTVHGLPQTPNYRRAPIRAAYAVYKRIGPDRTMARSEIVTAVSRAVADMLPAGLQVNVIPNGVSLLPSTDGLRAAKLLDQLALDPGLPIIAAAGRLSRSKGFDVLIRCLRNVDIPMFACVIAGADAGELSNLQSLAKLVPSGVRVRLPGWLDRQGLADLFALASVVAIPSRDEPFGLVGLEALGAARRVVSSRVGGLAEFLRPPVAQFLDSDDPIAWANALTTALLSGPLTDDEAKAANQILMEHTWPHVAHDYEVLMLRASRGHRNS